ncbi:c-type cytochrome [Thiococcus pfennigii]|uniref:c-type cytochrome n=1 Tax=Thiococcus pfennigii TaxID=1057 RepID=UPI001906304C|nr:cytochrome c4 [Thiococcus pfennigii]MBK1701234.1 cytochrome c4 [Thiococcus pfennigii]
MANARIGAALLGGLALLGIGPGTPAEELLDGADARTLAATCTGCHGSDGASAGPAVPSIGGMDPPYFIDVMEGFRSGAVYGTIMGRIAKGYSDVEIERMAGYFHDLPFVPAAQGFDPALAKTGQQLHANYCERCHNEGGTALEIGPYYILAGQWATYLRDTLEDFRDGRRLLDKKMERKLDRLLEREGEAGLEALLAYYASQQ